MVGRGCGFRVTGLGVWQDIPTSGADNERPMATFRDFEEIEAWQNGRLLTREVYRTSRKGTFARDFALRDQMRRAALSITSNIAEGFERNSPKAFLHFLSIAKGSAGELRSQCYVALDEGYLTQDEFHRLRALSTTTIRQIGGLMRYLRTGMPQNGRTKAKR